MFEIFKSNFEPITQGDSNLKLFETFGQIWSKFLKSNFLISIKSFKTHMQTLPRWKPHTFINGNRMYWNHWITWKNTAELKSKISTAHIYVSWFSSETLPKNESTCKGTEVYKSIAVFNSLNSSKINFHSRFWIMDQGWVSQRISVIWLWAP